MTKRFDITKEDCRSRIEQFYMVIAEKYLGITKECQFDCTKITVSSDVFDEMEKLFLVENKTMSRFDFGVTWCCFGPKATIEDAGYHVEVLDGFAVEV